MPAPPRPEISVIVPHRDDPAALARCLDALERQTAAADRFEIIVADNASRIGIDAVRAVAGERARVVTVATPGAGPARNGGVEAALGSILAFTDCDCLPEPGWLLAGVEALAPGTLVGGAMTVLVDDPEKMTAAEAFETLFAFDNEAYVRDKHFTVTANLFVHAGDFRRVGGFRTGVSEDMEWCLRARDLGMAIRYAGDAVIGHPARRTWPELRRKWERLMAEQYRLVIERQGIVVWLLRSWALPLSIVVHLPHVLRSTAVPRGRDRLKAALMLARLRLWRFVRAHRLLFGAG